jgi:hypothetical protein
MENAGILPAYMVIWINLRSFGIYYMAIWLCCGNLVYCVTKNLATLEPSRKCVYEGSFCPTLFSWI